ncbi:YgiW/YdeI family stress tolerance OB fold protein [[Haemophilus] felis]|nr:YgiW/YdeI family stress tolerance OB fold protein [[Haemophilus] felis]
MKKLMTLASLLAVSSLAVAQGGFQSNASNNNGGFGGFGGAITTVKAAKEARDDSLVTIEGSIVKHIREDHFLFRDLAGNEINIDVDDDAWNGQTIQPNERIVIQGKVDKNFSSTEIEVENIIKK